MIAKGMDVKDLVNSELFYVPVWTHMSLFSSSSKTEFLAYNEEIEELEFEDPNELFMKEEEKEEAEKKHIKKAQDIEVQYNYIFLANI